MLRMLTGVFQGLVLAVIGLALLPVWLTWPVVTLFGAVLEYRKGVALRQQLDRDMVFYCMMGALLPVSFCLLS